MATNPMTKSINALSARTNFGGILESVEKDNVRFLINRRGKPKAIILSVEDFLKNIVKQPDLLVSVQLDAQKSGLDNIADSEIEAEIKAYRKTKTAKK
jgi:prevent-host-death family protein